MRKHSKTGMNLNTDMFVCIPDTYETQALLPVNEVPLFYIFLLTLSPLVLNS